MALPDPRRAGGWVLPESRAGAPSAGAGLGLGGLAPAERAAASMTNATAAIRMAIKCAICYGV